MKLRLPWAKPKHNYWILLASILIAQLTGAIGSFFTLSAIPAWYATLTKPFFSPPNWVFGPVWTLLYTLMGISAYLVWHKYQFGKKSRPYWQAYGTQLALNALWSILFFGFKWVGVALLEIIAMWYFIYRSISAAKKIDAYSAYLLYPYLAWVSFAALLNAAILLLN